MNILITGGAGYIGSKVALDLINKNHNVVIVDNLVSGQKKNVPKKSIFYKCDISEKKKIHKILEKNKIDTVFHFAALISVEESIKKPALYIYNNYQKSKIFLNCCLSKNIKYFIFSSTAAVYGNKFFKVKENSIRKPINAYGKSKFLFENFIIGLKSNVNFCILRYFNVAGADNKLRIGQRGKNKPTHLIRKLIDSILLKRKFKIYGKNYKTKDGTAIRDFININDLSDIHIKSMQYIIKNKIKLLILNCGYGKGFSVKDVVFAAKKKYNFSYEITNKRKGDAAYVVADNLRLKKILKWKPKFNSLDKILKSSLEWELKNR